MSQSSGLLVALAMLAGLVVLVQGAEAKFLRRQRYYDELDGGYGLGPYGAGASSRPMATGERAILTVRGARSPFDGSAPAKIAIEDNPYRGPFPRGVYDRLDGGIGGAGGLYPRPGAFNGGYGGLEMPYGGGYGRQQMFGAPARIAVTGAFPYGYGARF